MDRISQIQIKRFDEEVTQKDQETCIQALEEGQVIYFPKLDFEVKETEKAHFSESLVTKDRKNLSFDLKKDELKGCSLGLESQWILHEMMKRYALSAKEFIEKLFPNYQGHIELARTSFRPVES